MEPAASSCPPPWTAGALLERSGELLELLGGVASLAELLPRAAGCLEVEEREVSGSPLCAGHRWCHYVIQMLVRVALGISLTRR